MLHPCSKLHGLHSCPCPSSNAHQAAPVRPHLARRRRDVRTPFRVSEPSDTHDSADHACGDKQLPLQDHLTAQLDSTQQQLPHGHHPANPYPLKNAQLGHSRFSRGAPHICYGQVGFSGVFYIKPAVDDLVDNWQQWFAGQQHKWAVHPQQHWQQQRRHVEAWMHAQQDRFTGFQPRQGSSASSRSLQAGAAGVQAVDAYHANNSSSSAAVGATQDHESLLNSIQGTSGAAGSLGIAVAVAAAVVAALKGGYLRNQGSARQLLFGAVTGVAGALLLMQCSKWLVAALFLCYAGIYVL